MYKDYMLIEIENKYANQNGNLVEEGLMGPIKGSRNCREKFENVINELSKDDINIQKLNITLLQYKIVKEDSPLLHDTRMPQIYSDIINKKLEEKGFLERV